MADTSQDTIYELLQVGADFDTEGYEVALNRPAFSPGSRGTLRRLVFVDPDFESTTGSATLTVGINVDGDPDSKKVKTISLQGAGRARRKKVSWKRVGRFFRLSYAFSSGSGTTGFIVDDSANNVADADGNKLVGKGEDLRFFRLLGQTWGFQNLGSRRR